MCDSHHTQVHWKHDAPEIGESPPMCSERWNQNVIDEYLIFTYLTAQEKNRLIRVLRKGHS